MILGVVVQGRYIPAHTMKIVDRYVTISTKIRLCLVLWSDEYELYLKESEENVPNTYEVIVLEKPEFSGPQNVNLQMYSSYEGCRFLVDKYGCDILIKTRSDHSIDLQKTIDLLEHPRTLNHITATKIRPIICIESTSYLLNPYHVCDFVSIGDAQEILKLYYPQYIKSNDDRNCSPIKIVGLLNKLSNNIKHLKLANGIYAESIIIRQYLNRYSFHVPDERLLKILHSSIIISKLFLMFKPAEFGYKTEATYLALTYKGNINAKLQKLSYNHKYSYIFMVAFAKYAIDSARIVIYWIKLFIRAATSFKS